MRHKKYLILIISLTWLLGFGFALAGNVAQTHIYFEVKDFDIDFAGDVVIDVLLDSLAPVNAYDIVFKYPENLIALEYVNMADSLINVIPEKIIGDEFGRIVIRGGSTAAFMGERGLIARLHFKASAIGASTIGFISSRIYLADGSGTVTESIAYHAKQFEIAGLKKEAMPDEVVSIPIDDTGKVETSFVDTVNPKILMMEIVEDPFDKTNILLVFDGRDSESGILHYLVRERRWLMFGQQNRVDNPYSINSGTWAVELVVVDNFGNEARKTVYRWGALGWKVLFILVLVLAILIVIKMYKLWHGARRAGRVNSQSGA